MYYFNTNLCEVVFRYKKNKSSLPPPSLSLTGAMARSNAAFGRGVGPIILSYMVCTGLESRLIDCPRSSFSTSSCSHQRDVGVECIAGEFQWCNYVSHGGGEEY